MKKRPTPFTTILSTLSITLLLFTTIGTPRAEAQFIAQPCVLTGTEYSCAISQTNPPKGVVITVTLTDDEAKTAATDLAKFRLPPRKYDKVTVKAIGSDGKATAAIVQVTIRVGDGPSIDSARTTGGAASADIPGGLELGSGKEVKVLISTVDSAFNVDEVALPALTVGVAPPPPVVVQPPVVAAVPNPIANLTVDTSGITNGLVEVGKQVTFTAAFDVAAGTKYSYKWAIQGYASPPNAPLVEALAKKAGTYTSSVTVTSGKATKTASITYRIVDKIAAKVVRPKRIFAGKVLEWKLENVRGGIPAVGPTPYNIEWLVDGAPSGTGLSFKAKLGKKDSYAFEIRITDNGLHRAGAPKTGNWTEKVTGCATELRKWWQGRLRFQVVDLTGSNPCDETTTTTPVSGAGTGWYWLEFKGVAGQFVDMNPDQLDNPNESDPAKRIGSYKIAAGYKFASSGKPQLVAPVGPGVGTLQLRINQDGTCTWNWGSVRGPDTGTSCSLSTAGGTATNNKGATTAYKLTRMSASEAQTAKDRLGGRTDFDSPGKA